MSFLVSYKISNMLYILNIYQIELNEASYHIYI